MGLAFFFFKEIKESLLFILETMHFMDLCVMPAQGPH